MRDNDTIAAIATAHGRSAIGIIRISGPGVEIILHKHVPVSDQETQHWSIFVTIKMKRLIVLL